ncbi:MAG: CheR family methyltransferase [Bdellovibrionota bacterium]|nr:CheR family methyltransferase [Bdellovibrionota bacterium]
MLRDFPIKNIETEFIKKSDFHDIYEDPLDETLIKFTKKKDAFQEVVVVILAGKIGEGHLGVGQLFDKGALCLLEAESDSESTEAAQSFLISGKAHLEINLSEMSDFLELYFEYPREIKTFFNPRTQIVWHALSSQFEEHGLDIDSYKHTFIFYGLLDRVSFLKKDFVEYVQSLEEDPLEINNLYDSLELHKSEFFKDIEVYNEFQEKVAKVFEKDKMRYKIWIPGCATGEEAFSFALVIYDYLKENNLEKKYEIIGTDTDTKMVRKTGLKKGQYSKEVLNQIPTKYQKYLKIESELLIIDPEVRSSIIFSPHNMISDPGFFNFDLVICRNILHHFKKSFQENIWQDMSTVLVEKGLLITDGNSPLPECVKNNFLDIGNISNTFFDCVERREVFEHLRAGQHNLAEEQAIELRKKLMFRRDGLTDNKTKGDEIEELKKELALTKSSLRAASMSFEKTFEEQVKSSDELKKANKELTDIKNNLLKKANEKTKQLEQTNTDLQMKSSLLKHTNLDLAKREYQLQVKTRELEESNKSLETIQKERSLFFAKLSHELRTPLNAILGFSGILLEKLPEDETSQEKEYLDCIKTSGKSLLALINSVHDFTKIDLHELTIIKQKMNLPKFLKDLSTYHTNECTNKGLKFFLDLDEDLPQCIESDEIRIRQVFDNLLSNAIKFTKKGHIEVKARAFFLNDDKSRLDIAFMIEDTGIGVEQEKLDKLFKTFSQVHDPSGLQERGTGLGLYISKQITEKLGGEIGVLSQPGKGTVFNITLKNVMVIPEFEEKIVETLYQFFGQSVLLADDIPLNLSLLEAYLSPYDLKIETAKDGQELIYKAKNLKPHLIVTDYKMPTTKGDEALEILEKSNIKIPIILVSALKVERDIKKKFQGFLQKPIDKNVFLNEISKFLKHKKIEKDKGAVSESFNNFFIPDQLGEKEQELLEEIERDLLIAKDIMDITLLETSASEIRKKIKGTKIENLSPWFTQLQTESTNFNIQMIEQLLEEGIKAIESYRSKIKKAS